MLSVLYFFSKTDKGIIHHCPAITKNIHATLGFFVLLTGVMAFFSGTYAISNMFIREDPIMHQPKMMSNGWFYASGLGVVYALFIMAIDREIVSASSRWMAVLRIPLAVIISLVVAVPVELKIFESNITKHLLTKGRDEDKLFRESVNEQNRIARLETEVSRLDSLREDARKSLKYWNDATEAEVVGRQRNDRTGKAGKGPAYEEAMKNIKLYEGFLSGFDTELKLKTQELADARSVAGKEFDVKRIPQSYDLLSKYVALKEVKKEDETGSAGAMGLGITILFCLFELIPSLMKIFTPQTEYDVLLDKRRRLNISATNIIYQKTFTQYYDMEINQIVEYNPVAVREMYKSQSV